MSAYGNRDCSVLGCQANGGQLYMDRHEATEHFACSCGWWVGLARYHPTHRAWAVRKGDRSDHDLRPLEAES